MRVFKPLSTSRGKRRRSPHWHVSFKDCREIRQRVVAFGDKGASEELGRKIEKLVALVGAGERPGPELSRWIEQMPGHVRTKLAAWGILNERTASASKPLAAHLGEWHDALLAKGNTAKSAQTVKSRATRVVEGAVQAQL